MASADQHGVYLHQQALAAAREEGRRQGLEEAAKLCETTTMDSVTNARNAQFAGAYVAGEYHAGTGARHHGMGYAAAIRALSPTSADPVAEAARQWKAAREAAMANVCPETFTELSKAESALSRAIAQKEGE